MASGEEQNVVQAQKDLDAAIIAEPGTPAAVKAAAAALEAALRACGFELGRPSWMTP